MSLLAIFSGIILALAFVIVAVFVIISLEYLQFFKWRSCKHCHHNMDYRGLKEDNNNGHFLFHCPKCGTWEQVPREEFIRQCENPMEEMP